MAATREIAPDEVEVQPEETTAEKEKPETRRLPPFAVVLHNDDINGFEYVVGVLCKVFRYNVLKSFALTLQAHTSGRSVVWSGAFEVAELKADQIRCCGPDPRMLSKGALPLTVTVEPMP